MYSLYLRLESGTGNKKTTKAAENCKAVSILKTLIKRYIIFTNAQT